MRGHGLKHYQIHFLETCPAMKRYEREVFYRHQLGKQATPLVERPSVEGQSLIESDKISSGGEYQSDYR
jgi:hypothetical protein